MATGMAWPPHLGVEVNEGEGGRGLEALLGEGDGKGGAGAGEGGDELVLPAAVGEAGAGGHGLGAAAATGLALAACLEEAQEDHRPPRRPQDDLRGGRGTGATLVYAPLNRARPSPLPAARWGQGEREGGTGPDSLSCSGGRSTEGERGAQSGRAQYICEAEGREAAGWEEGAAGVE